MVALVLHHARVEALDRAVDGGARFVESAVAQPREARHHAAHSRHRQAAFPGFLDLVAERRDHRIDEHRCRGLPRRPGSAGCA